MKTATVGAPAYRQIPAGYLISGSLLCLAFGGALLPVSMIGPLGMIFAGLGLFLLVLGVRNLRDAAVTSDTWAVGAIVVVIGGLSLVPIASRGTTYLGVIDDARSSSELAHDTAATLEPGFQPPVRVPTREAWLVLGMANLLAVAVLATGVHVVSPSSWKPALKLGLFAVVVVPSTLFACKLLLGSMSSRS